MGIRILCIHGVNTNENGNWLALWQQAIPTHGKEDAGLRHQQHEQDARDPCHRAC